MTGKMINSIELWKAIHGGCWPGPPPDRKLNAAVNEVIAGLALFNLANSFTDAKVSAGVKRLAVNSLKTSLAAVGNALPPAEKI